MWYVVCLLSFWCVVDLCWILSWVIWWVVWCSLCSLLDFVFVFVWLCCCLVWWMIMDLWDWLCWLFKLGGRLLLDMWWVWWMWWGCLDWFWYCWCWGVKVWDRFVRLFCFCVFLFGLSELLWILGWCYRVYMIYLIVYGCFDCLMWWCCGDLRCWWEGFLYWSCVWCLNFMLWWFGNYCVWSGFCCFCCNY